MLELSIHFFINPSFFAPRFNSCPALAAGDLLPRNAFPFNRRLFNARICPGIQLFSVESDAPYSYGKFPNMGLTVLLSSSPHMPR